MNFFEFVDRKQREANRHLKIMEKVLKKGGFDVKSYVDDEEDPYIFVKSPKSLSFEGIRIYEIGDTMAYRIQKEEKTHPYGKSYGINLEDMFNDFMSENIEDKKAGQKVIESIAKEIKSFFEKSSKAEQEMLSKDDQDIGLIVKTGGTDYSTTVLNKL